MFHPASKVRIEFFLGNERGGNHVNATTVVGSFCNSVNFDQLNIVQRCVLRNLAIKSTEIIIFPDKVCFHEWKPVERKGVAVNSLIFHTSEPTWLFCGTNDGTIALH